MRCSPAPVWVFRIDPTCCRCLAKETRLVATCSAIARCSISSAVLQCSWAALHLVHRMRCRVCMVEYRERIGSILNSQTSVSKHRHFSGSYIQMIRCGQELREWAGHNKCSPLFSVSELLCHAQSSSFRPHRHQYLFNKLISIRKWIEWIFV